MACCCTPHALADDVPTFVMLHSSSRPLVPATHTSPGSPCSSRDSFFGRFRSLDIRRYEIGIGFEYRWPDKCWIFPTPHKTTACTFLDTVRTLRPPRFVDKPGESKQGHITLSAPSCTFSSLSPSVLCMPHAVPFSPKMLSVPAAYLAVTIGPATAGPARDTVRQFMCSRPSPRRHCR
jgi:hypothetical protein